MASALKAVHSPPISEPGLSDVVENFALLYAHHQVSLEERFADFRLDIIDSGLVRRWFRPQVKFSFDGHIPFRPLPRNQAYAIFEWGLNWCIANFSNHYLMIHSGVLERNGKGLILPGMPGAGKSTLSAALMVNGWRLLSDEVALIQPNSGELLGIPRPISLKNQSIEVIGNYYAEGIFGRHICDTAKGTVAHLRPDQESIERQSDTAEPGLVIFPRFVAGSDTRIEPLPKSRAFMALTENAFNYSNLGLDGFHAVQRIINQSHCYNMEYSDLDSAVQSIGRLLDTAG